MKRGKFKVIRFLYGKLKGRLKNRDPNLKAFLAINLTLFFLPGGFFTPLIYSSLVFSKKIKSVR